MRLIDADKLYPDVMTSKGVAISQSQIANAPSVQPKAKPGRWIENLCVSCTNKACEFQSGIPRSKCDFYITPMPHLETDNCGNYVVQQEPCEDAGKEQE